MVEVKPITITDAIVDGRNPIREWITKQTKVDQARILARLDQAEEGNFGKYRNLSGGLLELKFNTGHRIYAGRKGDTFLLLLVGGDKSGGKKGQNKDIVRARDIWAAYLEAQ